MELPPVASKLDGALGLTLDGAEDGVATLRLDPGEVAVVEEEERSYLHGGTLATCIDTAAWYAAASASMADWLVTGLQLEALRLARPEPHSVIARCVRAGRTRAVVDVEIVSDADPERVVTVGRVSLLRG
ncbi:MAG TPA: hotdog domain-containing protein [Solirubrobacterales bacterium]|nr:hotdog domain-containing protein [Solirubrobacterales bacterium]